jgi:hypothetical protein
VFHRISSSQLIYVLITDASCSCSCSWQGDC